MMPKQAHSLRTTEGFSHFPTNNADELICSDINCCCCLIPKKLLERQISKKRNEYPLEQATKLIVILMKIWLEALTNFLDEKYYKHDALVGENACQIRAAILLDLVSDLQQEKIQELRNTVKTIKHIIDRLFLSDIDKPHDNETFQSFIHRNILVFTISREIVFIITSYLLTLTKVVSHSDNTLFVQKTELKVLQERGLSCNNSIIVVKAYQKLLSAYSCYYIKTEASALKNSGLSLLTSTIITDSWGRSCLPLLTCYKVILSRILQKNQNILVHVERRHKNHFVDQVRFFYQPNQGKTDFELSTFPSTKNPCIIIGGVVNYENEVESLESYKDRFHALRLLGAIYANCAVHPQYPSEYKDVEPPFNEILSELMEKIKNYKTYNPNDNAVLIKKQIEQICYEKSFFYAMRKFANENGLCLQNPSLFFLNHVYCDVVEDENFTNRNF